MAARRVLLSKRIRAACALAAVVCGLACDPASENPAGGGPRPEPAPTDSNPVPSDTVPADTVSHRPRDSSATPAALDSGYVRGGGIRAAPLFDPSRIPLARPVWFGEVPGRPGSFIALEQFTGSAVLIRKTAEGWERGEFLKLAVRGEGEMGLLGLAFHPRFAENRKYYVHYVPQGGSLATVIDEREADAAFLKDAGKPPRRVLELAQPYQNHKSAAPAFGPKDGYLYVPIGDGGATVAGQDRSRLLGKILRIDVDAPDSFKVPADNPFVNRAGTRPEIWALGVRNPWRWSFDPVTGALWLGDVGESEREEIDVARAGDNLGWGWMEGNLCHQPDSCRAAFKPPLVDFPRDRMTVLVGGYVYRGDPASPWYGSYFFADYGTAAVWVLRGAADGGAPAAEKLLTLPSPISSFGTDAAGNLYAVGHLNGAIYRLESDSGSAPGRGRL